MQAGEMYVSCGKTIHSTNVPVTWNFRRIYGIDIKTRHKACSLGDQKDHVLDRTSQVGHMLPISPADQQTADSKQWHQKDFPSVPWGPSQLAKVLGGTCGCLLLAGIITQTSSNSSMASLPSQLLSPNGMQSDALHEQGLQLAMDAWAHVAREASLLLLTAGVLSWGLADSKPRQAGLFAYQLTAGSTAVTVACCLLLFPMADPVLSGVGKQLSAMLQDLGWEQTTAGSSLADSVTSCVSSQAWDLLSLHVLASGFLGPLWEETFWRGFFLTSLTRVLPLPACVALSSTWFAALHLSPANFLSIWLLAAASDVLYLRTASLGPPLLLHGAWNTAQLLAVAFLGKETFV